MTEEILHFSPPERGHADVLFIAGEHSGDQHAALVAREMRERHPEWKLAAVGGPALAREGVQLLHDLTRDSVVGLVEVLRHYGTFKRIFDALIEWVGENRPRVVVLVDYPGFNLRFAAALKKQGISRKGGGNVAVYQYISPQIWAWKAGRRFRMAKVLDGLGVIFPFEVDCYKDTDLAVHFTGHPFVREGYRNPLRFDAEGPILLLPGSRRQAVGRIFPILLETIRKYHSEGGARRCVCLYPEDRIRRILEEAIGRSGLDSTHVALRPVEQGTTAAAVLTSSGTMSLNCALAGVPGAIVYRAHPLTAWMGRRLIRIPWLGIANLVLGRDLYPEYLQGDAKPALLCGLLQTLLGNAESGAAFRRAAEELREHLRPGTHSTVTDRISELI
ncbi:MAG: lipid-A-disaccharide synthase [Oceanipulchritudo sp.]